MSAPVNTPVPYVDADVPRIISGADQYVAAWVALQLDIPREEFGACSACGVMLGDRLIAGVVFNEYRIQRHGSSMQGSIASISPRWATRPALRDIFSYPFGRMGVTRFWASTARKNKRARKMLERLGFRFEGIGRKAYDGIQDAAMYAMLAGECVWINGDPT